MAGRDELRAARARLRLRALRRRRGSRGATIFLVTLVMTLLTAMGVFAARSTSLAGRSAGYMRQSDQGMYLMQHGMALTLNEIDRGATIYGKRNQNNPLTNQSCTTTAAYPAVKLPCVRFSTDWTKKDSFQTAVERAQQAAGKPAAKPLDMPGGSNLDPNLNTPGSLGPWMLLPSMYVEMTDISDLDRTPPGYAMLGNGSQLKFRQATLVGIGQVGPWPANGVTANCSDVKEQGAATVVARRAGRGQIIFGPTD